MPYWGYLLAAAAVSVCLFGLTGKISKLPTKVICCSAVSAMVCAALGAKIVFVLMMCSSELPRYGLSAFTRITPDSFCFTGGAAAACGGAALAAFLLKEKNLRALLDAFTPAWLAAIAILRAGEGALGSIGYGSMVPENSFGATFPFAVQNKYGEWYAAIFLLEALAALLCLIPWLLNLKKSPGTAFTHTAYLLAAAQILLENLRARGMKYGFVHAEQIICAVILMALLFLSCRRGNGSKKYLPCLRLLILIGLIVGEEFLRQKSGIAFFSHYSYVLLVLILSAAEWLFLKTESKAVKA